MRIIINNQQRGREWDQLEKYWLMTQEKLERSDHDFDLAFNRLLFIARSDIGLHSANVIVNLLLYVSIMYKACYQSSCVTQAYRQFIKQLISSNESVMTDLHVEYMYHSAFQHTDITSAVSHEFYLQFAEMLSLYSNKITTIKTFFMQNDHVLLQLVATLSSFALGYQQGNNTSRRAYLFAKLLRMMRHVLFEQYKQTEIKASNNNDVQQHINLNSIIPNLKTKLSMFDFAIDFKSSQVVNYEIASDQQYYCHKIFLQQTAQVCCPEVLYIHLDDKTTAIGSMRNCFNRGEMYFPGLADAKKFSKPSQVYLAVSGSVLSRHVVRKVKEYCHRFYAKLS